MPGDGFYGSAEWKRLRLQCLARDPRCKTPGCGRRSSHADHIVPRCNNGPDTLANLRGLCQQCHNRRTGSGNGALQPIEACDPRGLPTDPSDPWWQP